MDMWDAAYPYVAALLPTIGVLLLFYVVIRNVLAADRQERRAQAQWDRARRDTASLSDRNSSGFVPGEGRHASTKELGGSARTTPPTSSDDSGQYKDG